MPVPLFEAGSFVASLEERGAFVGGQEDEGRKTSWTTPVTSRGDRALGVLGQYELRFSLPLEFEAVAAAHDEEQRRDE